MTVASGINNSGQIVGSYYTDVPGGTAEYGFVAIPEGSPPFVTPPGSSSPPFATPESSTFFVALVGGLGLIGYGVIVKRD
jgi:hypothetical protein